VLNESRLDPLKGLRVLDLTGHPPGAMCTVMLADLGAEVVRVEAPVQKGKTSLVIGQVALSRGKRSITLDLRNPDAVPVLSRLASKFDVIVEASRPGTMEARGFGYKDAKAINPGIVWCAMTGFGQDGPNANHAGHDFSYLAHSGLLAALSIEQPFHPAISMASQAAGLTAVVGIQGALLEKSRTGRGAFVDVSLSEAATWFLTCGINPLAENPYLIAASPDRRLYECADGRFVAVASQEPRTWGALCNALGFPEFVERLHKPEYAEQTTSAFAGAFLKKSATAWVEELSAAGATTTLVNHAAQLLDDPQIRARGSIVMVEDVPVPASPIRLRDDSGAVSGTATAAPHIVGQDTEDILGSIGFSQKEIADLGNAKVI
jgi:crotonobetainyl-CoA:carnitine CoA-transferase CaiB-like acyl-CoA transferase